VDIAAVAVGLSLTVLTRRLPSRGWIAITLLLLAIPAWTMMEGHDGSRSLSLPISMLFWIITPFAVVYSLRTKRHAPDRLPALAAFIGGFIIGGLYLFTLAGLVMLIYVIFAHPVS
jgi:hypothetical protein